MRSWGKVTGALLGVIVGGLLGGLIGLVIGHQFDKGFNRSPEAAIGNADLRRIQLEFFTATFSIMGHLAKADGRVSEKEIEAARTIMQKMRLSSEQTRSAMRLFSEGKRADFPVATVVQRFLQHCGQRHDLVRSFMEIQIQACLADGGIHPEQRRRLWTFCTDLGLSRVEFAQMEALIRAHADAGAGRPAPKEGRIGAAYSVLGIARDAEDAVVKKAYRRLMSQHHPDKLVSRGLPEEMMQVAAERTQEIRAAYDLVKEARGMR